MVAVAALLLDRHQPALGELGEVPARGLRADAGPQASSFAVSARPSMRAASMLARAGSPSRPATSGGVLPETIVMAPSMGRENVAGQPRTLRPGPKRPGATGGRPAGRLAAVQPGEETA